jgi:hypothetical protein
LGNWRIIDRLRWTIGTKLSVIRAADIVHVVIIITVHNNYPLPVLEYTLLYSQKSNPACTIDMEGDGLPCFGGMDGERIAVYRLICVRPIPKLHLTPEQGPIVLQYVYHKDPY